MSQHGYFSSSSTLSTPSSSCLSTPSLRLVAPHASSLNVPDLVLPLPTHTFTQPQPLNDVSSTLTFFTAQSVPPSLESLLAVSQIEQVLLQYLSLRDISVCGRVCRHWAELFHRHLWRTVKVTHAHPLIPSSVDDSTFRFLRMGFARNRLFIRSISTTFGKVLSWLSDDDLLPSWLEHLECDSDQDAYFDLTSLIRLCTSNRRNLESLKVVGLQWSYTDIFEKLSYVFDMSGFNRLRSLEFAFQVRAKKLESALALCPGTLEKLVLRVPLWYPDYDDGGPACAEHDTQLSDHVASSDGEVQHQSLKHLEIHGLDTDDILHVLIPFMTRHCRALRVFRVGGIIATKDLAEMLPKALEHSSASLTELSIAPYVGSFSRTFLLSMIGVSPHQGWRKLDLQCCQALGAAFFKLLKHNSEMTLQYIDLRTCTNLKSVQIAWMLTHLPNLLHLDCLNPLDARDHEVAQVSVSAQDLARCELACLSIRVLRVRISGFVVPCHVCVDMHRTKGLVRRIKGSDQALELQHRVYERLGSLTRLEELSLGTRNAQPAVDHMHSGAVRPHRQTQVQQPNCLEICLPSGLDALVGLKNLYKLDLYRLNHHVRRPELEWMRAQWPRLEEIGITVGTQYAKNDQVVRWMRECHGAQPKSGSTECGQDSAFGPKPKGSVRFHCAVEESKVYWDDRAVDLGYGTAIRQHRFLQRDNSALALGACSPDLESSVHLLSSSPSIPRTDSLLPSSLSSGSVNRALPLRRACSSVFWTRKKFRRFVNC